MGEEEKQNQKNEGVFAKEDLDRMRQEVLKWVDKMEKKSQKEPFIKKGMSAVKNNIIPKLKPKLPTSLPKKTTLIKPTTKKERPKTTPIKKSSVAKPQPKINKRPWWEFKGNSPKPKIASQATQKPLNKVSIKMKPRPLPIPKKPPINQAKPPRRLAVSGIFDTPSRKKVIASLIVTLCLVFIGQLATIYLLGWRGAISTILVRVIPLPAMSVNGEVIKCDDYFFNYQTFASIANNNEADIDISEMKDMTKEKLTLEAVVSSLAEQYGITVTKEELNNAFSSVTDTAGSVNKFKNDIINLYDWSLADFQQKVLKPNITRQKVTRALLADKQVTDSIDVYVQSIMSEVLDGSTSFEDAASKYSHDVSSNVSGDVGYIIRGEASPGLEEILFSMNTGDISEAIRTTTGFYIFKIEDVILDSVTSDSAENDDEEEQVESKTIVSGVKVRQIFISPEKSIDEYIDRIAKEADVKVFLR